MGTYEQSDLLYTACVMSHPVYMTCDEWPALQDLRAELVHLHSTVTDLDRRYADLAGRYREAREKLDEVGRTQPKVVQHFN